ncbi:class I SAM-dependent methyltransferase [Microcoleus sp. herbarium14]|uniref:class I SAM-dependent methyltransferase n=1 Tax=Microcoleus sp. herbarium14 TaxID=3055439 RepID=UPI002FD70AE1
MKNQESAIIFDQKYAASYDKGTAFLAPMRDALHALIRAILAELPIEARILCVGAGTGSELINLAEAFPQWQFTAVEPAAPMLNICRHQVEERGFTSRCTFHEGYLDSLPASEPFDAATCLLVSQFFMKQEERRNFFNQIALRLRPNGYLISSDVVSDLSTSAYQSLLTVWLRMMRTPEMSDEDIARIREKLSVAYSRDVAVLPPHEVASIISSSGFDPPVLFFQNLLIHAWFSRRTALD